MAYPSNPYSTGKQLRLVGGAPIEDVWIEHNTTQPTDNGPFTLDLSKGTFQRFTYRNNIVGYGAAGPVVEGVWTGEDSTLDAVAPGRDFKANALVGSELLMPLLDTSSSWSGVNRNGSAYPTPRRRVSIRTGPWPLIARSGGAQRTAPT